MREYLARFLPPSALPAERADQHRAYLTLAGAWIAAALGFAISAMQAAWGVRDSAIASGLLAAGCLALPFWVRRTGRWRVAAALLTAMIWCAALAVSLLTGGTLVPALYYLVYAAAVGTITLGPRLGVGLGLANAAVIATLYGRHLAGVPPPHAVDPEVGLASAMRGALVINAALAALVTAYEWLRAAALRESQESERRYRALADYGPDLIAEIDAGGRVANLSAGGGSLATLLGGGNALDAIHEDDRGILLEAVRQLSHQSSVRVGPIRGRLADGGLRWFEAALTRFRVRSEARILVVAREVTERVQLESQLRQSQKMQAVGQLASGLAHDFNNVLMVVSGYAETLAGRLKSDPDASAALEEIQRASDQGAALTRRLLALSRPSALNRAPVDLNGLVRANEKMLRVMLGESVTLLLEIAAGDALVNADGGELEQVLVNLVANARDALPGGGTVRIATFARGARVALVVHDNGAGIAPALRERIFEPFFTTKPAGHGTGLGLYVVYSIVSGLGGEIELQTDVGAGTRVTVMLPQVAPDERATQVATRRDRARGGSECVLVVEDRPELRELLRSALADAGYRMVVAADGLEALALDVRDRVDVVVTDVVMPRMGGVALVAALREKRPELRALYVSGHPTDVVRPRAHDRVLRKPFLIQDLQRTLRDVLDAT
jgi:PAS domain S-box-containing protein